jgi:hypothetical protein
VERGRKKRDRLSELVMVRMAPEDRRKLVELTKSLGAKTPSAALRELIRRA